MRRIQHARKYRASACAAGLIVASNAALGAEGSWGYRVGASYNEPNRDGLFFLDQSPSYGLLEPFITYKNDGLYLNVTAYSQSQDRDAPLTKGVINEWYLDTKTGDWDLTIGKKRIEWGVGFGFRPLDVIRPVRRRELLPLTPEGLPLVAFERYTAASAVTFLVGNDFSLDDAGYLVGNTEYAARYFALVNGWDLQAAVHARADVDYETGGAFSWVASEELELHGSALYQRRYRKLINTLTESGAVLATSDPTVQREFNNGLKGLVGGTYTWRSGHALLLEYWHDDAGYSAAEWRQLRSLTQAQRALREAGLAPAAAVNANILASTRFLAQPNLMQQNLLLRWSFDNGEHFVPALDVLYTPQDRGTVTTLSAQHDIGTTYNLNYGIRYYGGDADSVYRSLPFKTILYASLKATFNW